MWTTIQPEIMARLPRHALNGACNGAATSDETNAGHDAWRQRIEDIGAFRAYRHDWDGQGAEAPSSELVESAEHFAHLLRQVGSDAPSCVVPGVNGTLVFEWHGENGSYFEIEITAPDHADACLIVPGRQPEHWTLNR